MQLGWTPKYDTNSDEWEQQVKNKWKAVKEQLVCSGVWEEVFGHLQRPWKEHWLGCREENFVVAVLQYSKEV